MIGVDGVDGWDVLVVDTYEPSRRGDGVQSCSDQTMVLVLRWWSEDWVVVGGEVMKKGKSRGLVARPKREEGTTD
jgi:hypothetical protein